MEVVGQNMAGDYYQVNGYMKYLLALGLKEDANFETCHQAYLKLLKQWHPDLYAFSDPKRALAERKTQEITEAFERLKSLKFSGSGGVRPRKADDPEQKLQQKLERLPVRVTIRRR